MALSYFFNNQNISGLRVWTSWLTRTIQTASGIQAPQERWKALNEIDAGVCEELTYQQISERFPAELAARDHNKLTYRYPGAPSYEDIVARFVEPAKRLNGKAAVDHIHKLLGHPKVLVFGEFLEAYCAAAADLLGAESCERGMLLGLDLLCDLSMKL